MMSLAPHLSSSFIFPAPPNRPPLVTTRRLRCCCCCNNNNNNKNNNNSNNNTNSPALSISSSTLTNILNSGVIACLRAQSADVALEAARAAITGGISVLEIVVSTPRVFEVLHQLAKDFPTTTLGVGTILNIKDAENAKNAGAKFIMSPAILKGILDQGSEDLLYIPGVMTPTEVLSSYNAGAKIVKEGKDLPRLNAWKHSLTIHMKICYEFKPWEAATCIKCGVRLRASDQKAIRLLPNPCAK